MTFFGESFVSAPESSFEHRRLGNTELFVSPVGLGCWPISGMSSVDVNDADSLETLSAALDAGINFFDTAYGYGAHGESERLIATAVGARRDRVVLATKGGIAWDQGARVIDARPATLRQQCEESLRRLNTDHVDLLYLHAPDPKTPLSDSAGALCELQQAGQARAIGASNMTLEQLTEFHRVCRLAAFQPAYNMLQREIEREILPWCVEHQVAVVVYWPLMKGLLAGHLRRDHVFRPGDGRGKYPMFQGDEWSKNLDFVDQLRAIAAEADCTVAQLAVAWTIQRPGVTAALCGARRASQIRETAQAVRIRLEASHLAAIEAAVTERGDPAIRLPV